MSFELWFAFALASTALLAVPGPTVMLVVSYALNRGRVSGWATVPGVALGDFTAMTLSLLGAGAILAASAAMFTALKLAGAAYLVWLGIRMWRASSNTPTPPGRAAGAAPGGWFRMFANAYIVTALNPKGIVFFVAFVPQFVDVAQPLWPQFIILEATFLTLAAVNIVIWAVLAGEMRTRFHSPPMLRRLNRIGAGFLVGAGFVTALVRPGG
ncbi:MAG: LysE family translocator [Alphaproteobacteria bacterium]